MVYTRLSSVYGLTYSEINSMPLSAIMVYMERVPAVLAEWRLIAADGALIPHIKRPQRTMKAWEKLAYGEVIQARKATPGILKLMGIGVVRSAGQSEPG